MTTEDRLRDEIVKCRRCEACRELAGFSCLVFPEIFRQVDKERDSGRKISREDLDNLVGLCNLCGICPCRDIRSALLAYKTDRIGRRGPAFKIRLIESVERIGRLGSICPNLTNSLLQRKTPRHVMQKVLGIHRERIFPLFPKQTFDGWLRGHQKIWRSKKAADPKVAYFAGCTARYLFPEVARAVVGVLERNHVDVIVPDQQCCGMPTLLEGDRKLTLRLTQQNIDQLAQLVAAGYDIVCSCPTCGYMLKKAISGGAEHAVWYREIQKNNSETIEIPVNMKMPGLHNTAARVPLKFHKALY